jgi:hypothetical protein
MLRNGAFIHDLDHGGEISDEDYASPVFSPKISRLPGDNIKVEFLKKRKIPIPEYLRSVSKLLHSSCEFRRYQIKPRHLASC